MPLLDTTSMNYAPSKEETTQRILEAGISLFVLQHREKDDFERNVHGFDDVVVREVETRNEGLTYRVSLSPTNYIVFEADQRRVLTAFVPDIPDDLAPSIYKLPKEEAIAKAQRNRNAIARSIRENTWRIIKYYTPTGEVPVLEKIMEVKTLAKELAARDRKRLTDAKVAKEVAARKKAEEDALYDASSLNPDRFAPASIPAPVYVPRETSEVELPELSDADFKIIQKESESEIHKEHEELLEMIKKGSPTGYRATKLYKKEIIPKIEDRILLKRKETANVNQDASS